MRLSIPDCESATSTEIVKLVALELAPHVAITLAGEAPLTATLQCESDRAVIRVHDSDNTAPLELLLPLADTRREARPRLLALAIAELIATSRLEHTARREPPAAPVPTAPEPPSPPVPPLSLGIAAGVARAFEPTLWSPSLQLTAAYGMGSLELQADIAFDTATRSRSEAALDARSMSLGFAPGLRLRIGALTWQLAAGLRVGATWLSAVPRQSGLSGRTISGLFLAPLARTALQLELVGPWYVSIALELAYVVKPVRGLDADDVVLLELRGLRAASWFGAGVRL